MKKKDLIEQLVSEIETGRVRTLGIYGHGASGKSTFAQELYQALDSTKVNLLETDPYITSERHLVVPKQAPDQNPSPDSFFALEQLSSFRARTS